MTGNEMVEQQEMPAPPVPMHVDLAGYGFMPLYGHRLFGSDFNARCTDAEWRAGVTLWWAAWNQVPAASLPDDDVVLCRLADLGRDVKSWLKIRTNALHGFVRCSDGRLYHQTLAHLALEAWDRRIKDRERKARWRERINLSGDGSGDGDRSRDRNVVRNGDKDGTSPLKRSEAKRSEAKRTIHTPPNPPQAGGGVGVESQGADFEARLTQQLDRLGVASGREANRRWLAQAQRNKHVRTPEDLLSVIVHAVRRGRELLGERRPDGRPSVNHASDVREWFISWRPAAATEPVAS